MSGRVAETARLLLRRLTPGDAAFFHRQVNEPSWIANIGDRNVRSVEEAADYIRDKTLKTYEEHGFGMYLVERKEDGAPVGLCGLVRRDSLPGPDLGFALLETEFGKGYAREAAVAAVQHAWELGIKRLLAIVLPSNERSSALLVKIGFRSMGWIRLNDTQLRLYALDRA
jgi:RimJ/RimL family protein N-acetyltransferase